jgi:formylmethanofuran dehydrogenase subunit D
MTQTFLLIPGRTSRQGTTLNEGKYTDGYREETSLLRMNPDDMQRLGLADGDRVRMWNDVGEVVVPCTSGKDELPAGMLFISYGPNSSLLMGGETHGSGMPDSKGLPVYLEKVSEAG